jgi:hypothetical protein
MIRVLGFKQTMRPNGDILDWVNFTSGDGITETGEPAFATWMEVRRITPPEFIENDTEGLKMAALRSQWAQIEPHYLAWKAGHEITEAGTPLGVWPAITNDEAESLRAAGIRTVEDVAALTEDRLARPILPRLRDLKRQAGLFIEKMGDAEMKAEIAKLQEQNAAMLEMLAERKAEEAGDQPKRGPGRPRKDEVEAA